MWKQVLGVQAKLENQEWKVMLSNLNQKNVEVYRYAWIGDYNDPYTFLEIFQQNASMNHSGFADPAYDAALKTAAGTLDLPTRAQQLQEAEKIVTDNYAVAPIYHYVTVRLLKPYVKGYEPNIMGQVRSQYLRIEK